MAAMHSSCDVCIIIVYITSKVLQVPGYKYIYVYTTHIVNPRRAEVLGLCVCLSVCLPVNTYSRTTGYKAAYDLQTGSDLRGPE